MGTSHYQCSECGNRTAEKRSWCELCGELSVMPVIEDNQPSVGYTARDSVTNRWEAQFESYIG